LKNVAWILCVCTLLASGLAEGAPPTGPSNNGRVLYKWVDSDGVTHYGDRVPPEYASQEQHILNSRGYEIDHRDAQKTAQQLAADERKKLETEQSQTRDKNLLSTYASVQEIERLRDQRVQLVADQIKVTNQFLETLNGRMKKMRADAGSDGRGPGTAHHGYAHAAAEPATEARRRILDEHSIRERHRSLQRVEAHSMTPKTRVLLGVTGGIAAYKSPDLVRRLIERGADVQVVMTSAAQRFVSPMTFQPYPAARPAAICGTTRRKPPWATSSWRAGRRSC
jgi:3-polyprenyl-4-hydroxybenzoate decarboxylase